MWNEASIAENFMSSALATNDTQAARVPAANVGGDRRLLQIYPVEKSNLEMRDDLGPGPQALNCSAIGSAQEKSPPKRRARLSELSEFTSSKMEQKLPC